MKHTPIKPIVTSTIPVTAPLKKLSEGLLPSGLIKSAHDIIKGKSAVIENTDGVVAFLRDNGAFEKKVIGLDMRRTEARDIFDLKLQGGSILILSKPGGFIALERSKGGKKEVVPFREDIRHAHSDFLSSIEQKKDVTYKDPSPIKGKLINPDRIANLQFEPGTSIKLIEPTWLSEDWVTFDFTNGGSLVVRADRNSLEGIVFVNRNQAHVCSFSKELLAALSAETKLPS